MPEQDHRSMIFTGIPEEVEEEPKLGTRITNP